MLYSFFRFVVTLCRRHCSCCCYCLNVVTAPHQAHGLFSRAFLVTRELLADSSNISLSKALEISIKSWENVQLSLGIEIFASPPPQNHHHHYTFHLQKLRQYQAVVSADILTQSSLRRYCPHHDHHQHHQHYHQHQTITAITDIRSTTRQYFRLN